MRGTRSSYGVVSFVTGVVTVEKNEGHEMTDIIDLL